MQVHVPNQVVNTVQHGLLEVLGTTKNAPGYQIFPYLKLWIT